MSTTRVLYLTYYYLPHVGGATWTTYHLSMGLCRKGMRVQLIAPNVKHKLTVSPQTSVALERINLSRLRRTPMIPLPWALGFTLSAVFVFFAALRLRKDVDVILSQYLPHHLLTPVAILLGRILRVPVVLRADDTYRDLGVAFGVFPVLYKILNQLNEIFIGRSSRLLVVTSEAKARLESRLRGKLPDNIIALSPNGVDLTEFQSDCDYIDTRSTFGIRPHQKVIVFAGHFSAPQYGIGVLLEAMPLILMKVRDAVLFLVGDQPTHQERSMISVLGLQDAVRVYGPQPPKKMIEFVKSADVCIGPLMPTSALPLKVLEYMACGKPVVTGRNSVSRDLAKDGVNCLIVDPKPSEVGEAVLTVLTDEEYASRLGKNARVDIRRFDWNTIVDDLSETLREAVRHRNHEQLSRTR